MLAKVVRQVEHDDRQVNVVAKNYISFDVL